MKKTSTLKKILVVLGALVAVVAIVAASVYGTVAYLTSSALVQNSFTIGQVGITMSETKVTDKGVPVGSGERTTQNSYLLMPGASYVKDPTIYVAAESQPSYLFIIVRNDLSASTFTKNAGEKFGTVELDTNNSIEVHNDATKPTILSQLSANGWKPYTSVATGNVYVYCGVNAAEAKVKAGDEIKVFETMHISEESDETLHKYGTAQINIRAFAIQDTGFSDDAEKTALDKAWTAIATEYSTVIVPATPGN